MIVVLNGGSSSGKTSIARCLKHLLGPSWLSLSVDDFVDALPGRLWNSPDGLVIDEGGEVRAGSQFRVLESAWTQGLARMAECGANLVLDDVFLDGGESQERMARHLGANEVFWVGVKCDPEIAAGREIARGDRNAGMAVKQAESVHQGVKYDLVVDAGRDEAFRCAELVARQVGGRDAV